MNPFKKQLSEALKAPAVRPEAQHLKQTLLLSRLTLRETGRRRRISFLEFLLGQIRFVGIRVWAAQAVLLAGLYVFLSAIYDASFIAPGRQIALLLCCLSAGIFMSALPFLHRSVRYRMAESEAACRFSMASLLAARFVLLAAGDAVLLCALFFMVCVRTNTAPETALFYLTVPWLAAASVSLYLLTHYPGRLQFFVRTGLYLAWLPASVILYRIAPGLFLQTFNPAWLCVCAGLLLFCVRQLSCPRAQAAL